ncbi:MAG: circularly permuted type 2 ATP-grasp protein [Cellvibrionales bacterium]|nr:circularly permuted type 2 ATP-grasp protein [Cellvibrionales bacterium]
MIDTYSFFDDLVCQDDTYNEVMSAKGAVKSHWQILIDEIAQLPQNALQRHADKARRLLRDDGATFEREDNEDALRQGWPLDPIPRIFSKDEWQTIENGLHTRTQMYDALLKDLYSERRIILEGILPPEVIFSHQGFQRTCQHTQINSDSGLFFHCTDMMRNAQGQWVVLNDGFQTPKGIGYTLENRTVVSRLFPHAFIQSGVKKLNGFYQSIWSALNQLSKLQPNSLTVILSKGQQEASYFEQSYLANLLGIPIVQSLDLLVRKNQLWMKTLDGLQPVGLVLRYIEDELCDPVELKNDSYLGVSGLLQAVRSGNVTIINPIGSGILENPILYKYLPDICQFYLQKPLIIDSVPTYWFNDIKDREYIMNHIETLVIKPAFSSIKVKGVWGADLDKTAQAKLIQQMADNPTFYVAQEQLRASQTPAIINGQLQCQPSTFRTFSVVSQGKPSLLKGGLAQVSQQTDTRFIRLRSEALSKDIWVLGGEKTQSTGFTQPLAPAHPLKTLTSLPSRVIENLYFLGRYSEKVEITLRIIRTYFLIISSEEGISDTAKNILVHSIANLSDKALDCQSINDHDQVIVSIIKGPTLEGSVIATLQKLLAAAEASKELLSRDTIRITNNLHDSLHQLQSELGQPLSALSHQLLEPLITDLLAFNGIINEQIRDIGWQFLTVGKRIERFESTSKLIQQLFCCSSSVMDQAILMKAFLVSYELFITFKREHKDTSDLSALIDIMLLDYTNPRSLIFQIASLQKHMQHLPHNDREAKTLTPDERILLESYSSLKLAEANALLQNDTSKHDKLDDFLTKQLELIEILANYINDHYFDHSLYPRQLVANQGVD